MNANAVAALCAHRSSAAVFAVELLFHLYSAEHSVGLSRNYIKLIMYVILDLIGNSQPWCQEVIPKGWREG